MGATFGDDATTAANDRPGSPTMQRCPLKGTTVPPQGPGHRLTPPKLAPAATRSTPPAARLREQSPQGQFLADAPGSTFNQPRQLRLSSRGSLNPSQESRMTDEHRDTLGSSRSAGNCRSPVLAQRHRGQLGAQWNAKWLVRLKAPSATRSVAARFAPSFLWTVISSTRRFDEVFRRRYVFGGSD